MSPTRREVLRTVGSIAALAMTGTVTGCNTFQNSNDVHTGPATVRTADVPVGGGLVIDKSNFVVTQPTKGTFKGFVRVCPHAGCQVDGVRDGAILCPCHGSKFAITDGHVTQGPATAGLGEATVTVKGDTLTISG
ncbi:Rieske (2Fe-2S) protein [Cutibacterium sp. WCA-380-WT-3A]|uniref:Cytochrome bc1 complex Rieske iron-sulfur subunit n=1 Tax=Cutibacterium porci TaxID=2605781 RepID=A0A7K0J776_9ACTN|nr:Rieske (2Fe-2S) protein [Cutibacterium porci]MSS45797.1 Rieske (2Fe-2S) protein [Cutibacterium porci]